MHGKDIGDPNILLQIAIKHNIDAEEFVKILIDKLNIKKLIVG